MFDTILIANRGEIACRIIRTARKMGIRTVAVYSQADKDALHVDMADEAVPIGPPPSSQSYLVIDALIDACRQTGAQAVHPGYGFLSERAIFAERLQKENIVFIGPNAKAIEAMGDKITSKKMAAEAGVSTVPGSMDLILNAEDAIKAANDIGFPVMIKASAGGGGKGMRIAHSIKEVGEAFERARSEALSSFGDDRIFMEKFVLNPRHIEIQVLGDKHGNIVHLGERECSIQRRNQKVIEEAPSPFLDEETRAAMGEQAVALAKAVGYDSAGTVEFVVGEDKSFYFLEMNTRLQVEHPVTEMITGLDLVEHMIRIAAGEKLSFSQSDVELKGWAVEARLCAEDPEKNFVPSIGRITEFSLPNNTKALRLDTGVQAGSEISMFYDPMFGKLIAHAPERLSAIDALAEGLDSFHISGIKTNLLFLSTIMREKNWRQGTFSTAYLAEHFPDGFSAIMEDEDSLRLSFAIAAQMHLKQDKRYHSGQSASHQASDFVACIGKACEPVSAYLLDESGCKVSIDIGTESLLIESDWQGGDTLWSGMINGHHIFALVAQVQSEYLICLRGRQAQFVLWPERHEAKQAIMPEIDRSASEKDILSPMPGLVISINVEEGQEISAGDPVAIVEAMKMENILRAEFNGVIDVIHVQQGDTVQADQKLISLQ
jgi:propionyl-CoA carboxylase alpha chain